MAVTGKITDNMAKIVGSFVADQDSIIVEMKDAELQRTLEQAMKKTWRADAPAPPGATGAGETEIVQWVVEGKPINKDNLKFFYAMLMAHNLYYQDVEIL